MSIYDSIGGEPAVRAAVDDFYARVLADRQLAPFFTGTDLQRLKAHQVDHGWFAWATTYAVCRP